MIRPRHWSFLAVLSAYPLGSRSLLSGPHRPARGLSVLCRCTPRPVGILRRTPRQARRGQQARTPCAPREGHAAGRVRRRDLPEAGAASGGYRTNSDAWSARSSANCGATPRTTVTSAPAPMAVAVRGLGTATEGPSGLGSEKNIKTITRT